MQSRSTDSPGAGAAFEIVNDAIGERFVEPSLTICETAPPYSATKTCPSESSPKLETEAAGTTATGADPGVSA